MSQATLAALIDRLNVAGAGGADQLAAEIAGASGSGASSDMIIQLQNAIAALVDAVELTAALTANGAGVETAKWTIFLRLLGTLVPALDIRPNATLFPAGSAAAPSVAFQGDAVANTSGFYWSPGSSSLIAIINGATQMLLQTAKLQLFPDASQIVMGTLGQVIVGCVSPANNAIFASTLGNMQMGSAGALATNATKGFLDLPTCAGAPSGVPSSTEAGHKSMVYDTTNNKIWVYNGSWRGVVVA